MKKTITYYAVLGVLLFCGTLVSAQNPSVHGLTLDATSSNYSTNDDLTANYTLSGAVESATAWYINWVPISVLYAPFEAGAVNALQDFSGSNNDLSLPGGGQDPVWSASAGHDGTGAFTFDGNDYLVGGNIFPRNSSYTKTAWVYITSEFGYRNIISGVLNADRNHGFKINPDGRLNAGHSFGSFYVADTDSMVNNQWYFCAVTFDYATGEMILYKDAVEVDRAIVPESNRSILDGEVLVGSKAYSFFFSGNIDDAAIYDRALSPEQIQAIYAYRNDLIVSQETRGNEAWRVRVTPFSSSEIGDDLVTASEHIQAPAVSALSLDASSSDQTSEDDLAVSFSENFSVVETATAWYRDGNPDALLYMPFDGGPVTALNDFSGNGNDAEKVWNLTNDPTWDPTGGHNGSGAFYFDGNDYLMAGNIFPLNSSYTKTAWIYNTASGYNNIISSVLHDDNDHFLKVNADGRLNAGHSFGLDIVMDPNPMNLNQWYFAAVTFDFSTGLMILYRDGVEVDRGTVPEALRAVADASVLIGALEYLSNWDGYLDEARIYDRALTPQQIAALYAGDNGMADEEIHGGELWHAEVTPFSTCEAGATEASNAILMRSVLLSDISDQSILEGASFTGFDLDDYLTLYEFTPGDITWSNFGNSEIGVTIAGNHVVGFTLPDANWYGSEDISFVATNPNGDADTVQATFTVENVNDAPVMTAMAGQSTDEDNTLTGIMVEFTDLDPSDAHTIGIVSSNPNVTVDNLSGNTSGSTFDLVPAANWNGTTQITVTVTDNGAGPLSDSEVFDLVVNPINDAPVLTPAGDQGSLEDNPVNALSVVFTDPDDGDLHTISVVSDESAVTVENLSGQISGSTYNLVPDPDWNGSAQITVTVTDNGTGLLSDVETYTYTVTPVNDAPVLTEVGDQSTSEDVTLEVTVTFSDPDASDDHTITVVSDEPNVSVANLSGQVSGSTYDLVPVADWTGTAQITVTVTDNGSGALSDVEVYTLDVHATNDAPVLTEIGNQVIDEDNSVVGLSVVYTDADATDTHTVTVVSSEAGVSVANLSGNASGSTYDLVPDANWNGSAQITVTVTDNGPGTLSDMETYTLTVNPINDAPIAINLSNNAVDEGVIVGTVVGLLSATDADANDVHNFEFMYEGGDEEVDNHFFFINGNELKVNAELDYELKNTFSLLVQVNDGHGGTLTQQVPVIVNNIVETGIGDANEDLSFKVYPVPAIDRVTVELDNPENAELLLEIYSNTGRLMHSEYTVHGNTIDLSEFSKGMYILRIQGEGRFETRKIIVGD
jgi:hypothetical protein